jgi:hypothetical protein
VERASYAADKVLAPRPAFAIALKASFQPVM